MQRYETDFLMVKETPGHNTKRPVFRNYLHAVQESGFAGVRVSKQRRDQADTYQLGLFRVLCHWDELALAIFAF